LPGEALELLLLVAGEELEQCIERDPALVELEGEHLVGAFDRARGPKSSSAPRLKPSFFTVHSQSGTSAPRLRPASSAESSTGRAPIGHAVRPPSPLARAFRRIRCARP
jgi:hypothetical protein